MARLRVRIVARSAYCQMNRRPTSAIRTQRISETQSMRMSDSYAPAVCDRLICGMNCLFYGAIPDTKSPVFRY